MVTTTPNDDRLIYAVITEGDGPFDRGELILCVKGCEGKPPAGHTPLRELGYPVRGLHKWDPEYELYDVDDLWSAIEHACAIEPWTGMQVMLGQDKWERSELREKWSDRA